MSYRTLRRIGYALVAVDGALSALAPRLAIRKNCRPWGIAFENVGDLEPRPWYLRMVRAIGVGMLAMGLTGLALEDSGQSAAESASSPADEPADGVEESR